MTPLGQETEPEKPVPEPVAPGSNKSVNIILLSDGQATTGPDPLWRPSSCLSPPSFRSPGSAGCSDRVPQQGRIRAGCRPPVDRGRR
ncbi:MAG TPA: hypothetical protein DIC34_20720 [Treponema sp.]|nr:hypothetical protein [Treponema sp.]